jgi:hypothetical protein
MVWYVPFNKCNTKYITNKLRGLSQRANYTDWATALVGGVSANFCGCHVVSVTDPFGRNLGFLNRSSCSFFSSSSSIVLTRLSNPVPDPLLLRKSGSAGNQTRTSGSIAKNSDH